MSKYIIEVDDNAVDGLFRAKGFNTLVFDQNGLDKLQKYEESVEEVEEEQPFPQRGDEYYTIKGDSIIHCCTWLNDVIDCGRMSIGNCFHTIEEAKFAIERLKVLTEMRNFAEPFDTKCDDGKRHYYMYYNFMEKHIGISKHTLTRCSGLYFESEEKAKECIKSVGEDRIKKYYLGVE